jgi:hypothetical protein
MNNYTINAVLKQLDAMKCVAYKIGLYEQQKCKMINLDPMNRDKIISLIPWLMSKNINGRDIYITQAKNIDRALILVDDLCRPKIDQMTLRGMSPACVIETSPDNYQVWVSLGPEPMSCSERGFVARALAEQFGGDIASADANHYGRLAGFTNRKQKYLANNRYPFVLCWEAPGTEAERSQAVRDWAKARQVAIDTKKDALESCFEAVHPKKLEHSQKVEMVFEMYYGQWFQCVMAKGKTVDYSRGDFAVACRMLSEGYDSENIANSMMKKSPNISERKKNHINDYIDRTIKAAKKIIIK